MSNHEIGYAMAEFLETIFREYDRERINMRTLKTLVKQADSIVLGHDGNSYEAFDFFSDERCMRCFRRYQQGEKYVNPSMLEKFANAHGYSEEKNIREFWWHNDIYEESLCKRCFTNIARRSRIFSGNEDMLQKFLNGL